MLALLSVLALVAPAIRDRQAHQLGEAAAREEAARAEQEHQTWMVEKASRWKQCVENRGVPVMGFGPGLVCVDEEYVQRIDGRRY